MLSYSATLASLLSATLATRLSAPRSKLLCSQRLYSQLLQGCYSQPLLSQLLSLATLLSTTLVSATTLLSASWILLATPGAATLAFSFIFTTLKVLFVRRVRHFSSNSQNVARSRTFDTVSC